MVAGDGNTAVQCFRLLIQDHAGNHLGQSRRYCLRHRTGRTQLNASTGVAGTFSYTPAPGTISNAPARDKP